MQTLVWLLTNHSAAAGLWQSHSKCIIYKCSYLLTVHTVFHFILKALHLIEEMDLNDDKKLSEAEILKNQDLFLNSEATDYGRQLHDERFYHEEL